MAGRKALKNKSGAKSRDAGLTGMVETKAASGPKMLKLEEPGVPASDHLIGLADGWATWRTICVRGTGFPVSMLEQLAAPEAVAAIDHLIAKKISFDEALHQAESQCRHLFEGSSDTARKALRRLLRQLSKERAPDPLPGLPEMDASLEALARALDLRLAAEEKAEESVAEAIAAISEALRETAQNSLFREAVAWQNRKALHQGIGALLRSSSKKRNADLRKNEQFVAGYLQRYCAKNESIGFFGPRGWGKWTDDGPPLIQRPGASLVTARSTHFEYWTINTLARVLSRNTRLRPWLQPRLNPRVRIEGDVLIDARGNRRTMRPLSKHVAAACDGEASAVEIATALVADPQCDAATVDEVYRALTQAVAADVVSWTLDVPVGPHPERKLRETLERVDDPVLRSQLTGPLDRLEAARESVAAVAGDSEKLDAALGKLESEFTQITGQNPYQHPGQVYAGRSLVYEDCRRRTEVEVGPEIRGQVGPPLALILQSARWFSHTIASRFEDRLNRLFPKLQAQFAPHPVPVTALDFLFDKKNAAVPKIVDQVREDLTTRWASILLPKKEAGAHPVQLSADGLHAPVLSAFAAPCPGWSGARHHSADIQIAAEGPEAVRDGRSFCVLGEIHTTDTMLMRHSYHQSHPQPETLIESFRRDVAQPRIFHVTPVNFRGHRKMWDPFLPDDFQLASDNSPPWRSKEEVLRISDLIIEKTRQGLVVRTRDNARRFPALVYFERLLWRESFTKFGLLPRAAYTPRITIDNLVVKRESWHFPCRDLKFLHAKTETERFIGARFWARHLGLPRWVFARFPQEFKPIYVDLESPASVETLAKLGRRALDFGGKAAELGLSEMLPNPNQSWLADAKGNLYTSEFRIVAVDPETWNRPGSSAP